MGKWIIWMVLLLLCGCDGSLPEIPGEPEVVEQAPALEAPAQPEAAEAPVKQFDLLEIRDRSGEFAVSPAAAAHCSLRYGDGNTCVFTTDLEFEELAEALEGAYDWKLELQTDSYCTFVFEDSRRAGYVDGTLARFWLFQDGGDRILSNQTVEMTLPGGASMRVLVPFDKLTEPWDLTEPMASGTVLAVEGLSYTTFYGEYYGEFCGNWTRISDDDFVISYPEGDVLYDYDYDEAARQKTLRIEQYAPYRVPYRQTLAQTLEQVIGDHQAQKPGQEVLYLRLEEDSIRLEMNAPEAEYWGLSGSNVQFVEISLEEQGITLEEAARQLAQVELPALVGLTADRWPLEDLEPLAGFTTLRSLDLGGYLVTEASGVLQDISAVANMPQLQVFSASNYRICDISALSGCPMLSRLCLCSNRIEDLMPLSGCNALASVCMDDNLIRDACILTGKVAPTETGLRFLSLKNNPLEVISQMQISADPDDPLDEMSISFTGTKFEAQSYIWGFPD